MRPARFPGLDGLRGVSIVIVIAAHGLGPVLGADAARYVPPGTTGVKIFFVLSGFLITTLLLEERTRTGRVDLWRFYARRALRILPPLCGFFAAMLILEAAGWYQIPTREWIGSATFTLNFLRHDSILGHTWSLAVEEQFYLAFPLLLVAFGSRRTASFCLAAIVLLGTGRYAREMGIPFARWIAAFADRWLIDFIAVGCLLAIAARDDRARAWIDRLRRPWCAMLAAIVLYILECGQFGHSTHPLSGVAIALIVWWAIGDAHSIAGRALNSRLLVWLGTISYSLYLWQQCFVADGLHPGSLATRFPLSVGFALLAGAAANRLLERPFDGWRRTLAA